jgi:hypothetical protein
MAGKRDHKSKRAPKASKGDSARQLFEALSAGPCSFCGRTPAEHEGLQFQRGEYRVCADCVTRMHRELKQDNGS